MTQQAKPLQKTAQQTTQQTTAQPLQQPAYQTTQQTTAYQPPISSFTLKNIGILENLGQNPGFMKIPLQIIYPYGDKEIIELAHQYSKSIQYKTQIIKFIQNPCIQVPFVVFWNSSIFESDFGKIQALLRSVDQSFNNIEKQVDYSQLPSHQVDNKIYAAGSLDFNKLVTYK